MAVAAAADPILTNAAIYLGAAVIAVPIFKRLGLGSILGYLAAGAVIGPYGFELVSGIEGVAHIAEFGVVLLLFVIGLELRPQRLWRLRAEIFGLGAAQVVLTAAVFFLALWAIGIGWNGALVAGAALALSSTALAVQLMRERRELSSPYGDRALSILLFQDIAIVPLLALAAFVAPYAGESGGWDQVAIGVAAICGLIFVGHFGLPWVFRLIAFVKADEIFTVAALLIVAGSALLMQYAGLSMAMGAFLAGVLLAETEFRHQIETDIEPFRTLFLGLFFVAVGMSVNLGFAVENWWIVIPGALVIYAAKAAGLYFLARAAGSPPKDAEHVAATLGQSGEFAFVLFQISASTLLLTFAEASILTATVALSMALTPLVMILVDRRWSQKEDMGDVESIFEADAAPIIVAGFGRTGQVVARMLRLRGHSITLIDNSPRQIRLAESFGTKVYFGDSTRLDVMRVAGAAEAKAIVLCINDREGAKKAVARLREAFPQTLIFAMTYDRFTEIEMREAGADEVVRESFESAIVLAQTALRRFDDAEAVDDVTTEFRRRDEELRRLQAEHGLREGLAKLREKYSLEDGF